MEMRGDGEGQKEQGESEGEIERERDESKRGKKREGVRVNSPHLWSGSRASKQQLPETFHSS